MSLALSRRNGMGDASYDALFRSFAARAVDPEGFARIRPGRPFPDPETCLKIQCGAISQEEAGLELLADCSFGGFAGAQSCADPLCAPFCGQTAHSVARASFPLPVAPQVELMLLEPRTGCNPVYWGAKFGGPYSEELPCGCGTSDFISEHPILSVLLLAGASYGIYRWRVGR